VSFVAPDDEEAASAPVVPTSAMPAAASVPAMSRRLLLGTFT
jgi:hypothetical protein